MIYQVFIRCAVNLSTWSLGPRRSGVNSAPVCDGVKRPCKRPRGLRVGQSSNQASLRRLGRRIIVSSTEQGSS